MKKIILLLFLSVYFITPSLANSGDTTWITLWNLRKITQYGNYDTSAVLPQGKTFRKIRLHYILGRYACPAGTQYCGSWDYTTKVIAMPTNADTLEMARIITPYATDWLNTNRTHDFIVDVTDYASILKGNIDFRYVYEGYSWGFTLTLKLEMIEGTPPMEVLSVKNIYNGYFSYGNTTNPIENYLVEKPFQYSSPAAFAFVKNIISGHGSDDNQCGEFCSKYYKLKVKGNVVAQKQLWKSDCGLNDISPQTGTWLYDRANWCPGQVVYPIKHDITPYTTQADTFSVDIDMEPYTSPNQSNTGGYNISSQLITYAVPNFATDVSIEDIIAPTNDPNYARSNNICLTPKIKIKNTGTNSINQVVFNYSITGSAVSTYTWTGNLPFLKDTVVELGAALSLYNGNSINKFNVSIISVNGNNGDENLDNNTHQSTYNSVKVYPNKFVVQLLTNAATSAVNPGYNEAHWTIKDDAGNTIYSRENVLNNTTSKDTVTLPDGCYTFIIDDDGCDGLSWWVYQYYNPNPGTGSIRFTRLATPPIAIKNFNGDFGCRATERFITSSVVTSINQPVLESQVQLYPNPAANMVNMLFNTNTVQSVHYTITDVTGKVVKQGVWQNVTGDAYSIDTAELLNGMYFMNCEFEKESKKKTIKFIVNR